MTPKEEMLLETWPKKRLKGKVMYMARYAVFYALIVGVISLLFRIDEAPVMEVIVSKEYLIKMVLFITIGLVIAHFKWNANNRRYDALKAEHSVDSTDQGPATAS